MRGNVMKYVVHDEVVGGPSLPKQQWRGTRKHYCENQETIMTNGESKYLLKTNMDISMLCSINVL